MTTTSLLPVVVTITKGSTEEPLGLSLKKEKHAVLVKVDNASSAATTATATTTTSNDTGVIGDPPSSSSSLSSSSSPVVVVLHKVSPKLQQQHRQLRPGMAIVSINDASIHSVQQAATLLRAVPAGGRIHLTLVEVEEEEELVVPAGTSTAEERPPHHGKAEPPQRQHPQKQKQQQQLQKDMTHKSSDPVENNNSSSVELRLFQLAQELAQHAHVHHATRILASVLVGGGGVDDVLNMDKEEEEDEDSNNLSSWLGIRFQERLGFIFVQSVDPQGPFGKKKTRIRPGQCVIRVQDQMMGRDITRLQDLQNYCHQEWLLFQQQQQKQHQQQPLAGIPSTDDERQFRITIETLDGWGTLHHNPMHILMEFEKPPVTNNDDGDGDDDGDDSSRPTPAAPLSLGLSFQKQPTTTTHYDIWLTSVAKDPSHGLFGLAAPLLLLEPTQPTSSFRPCPVVFVNGLPCPQSTPVVIKQLQEAYPMVSLEIREPAGGATSVPTIPTPSASNHSSSNSNSNHNSNRIMKPVLKDIHTVKILKPATPDARLGISLRKSVQIQSILIAGLGPERRRQQQQPRQGLDLDLDLACEDESHLLQVGQKLLQINGRPCPSSTAATVQLLQEAISMSSSSLLSSSSLTSSSSTTLTLQVATIDWDATYWEASSSDGRIVPTEKRATTTQGGPRPTQELRPEQLQMILSRLPPQSSDGRGGGGSGSSGGMPEPPKSRTVG